MAKTTDLDDCGCCAGVAQETPNPLDNLPSQAALNYRIGTHSQFKKSMLAALTDANRPALQALGTRDDDDFTPAYLDGIATLLDVLTFYQERYMNENFLRTSTERRSVLEMAKLIGYELSPGVAAATHLAFTLQTTPGTPIAEQAPITIPQGTRIQSVPGQDEVPQIFETAQDIEARALWNEVAAQTTTAYSPQHGDRDIYVTGINNNISIGDAILIVGQARLDNKNSERWDIRIVNQVELDNNKLCTRLVWNNPIGHTHPTTQPADHNVKLYVFRKRTSLFGHNAPDPRLMSIRSDNELSSLLNGKTGAERWWDNYAIQQDPQLEIDLANPEDKVLAGGWIALVSNNSAIGSDDLPGYVELYGVDKVSSTARTDYGMSGKITRIRPDTSENIHKFNLQDSLVLAASEELSIHPRRLIHPVFSDSIRLQQRLDGLSPSQYLSITGVRQRIKVAAGVTALTLESDSGNSQLNEGDSLQLASQPQKIVASTPVQLDPEEFGSLISSGKSNTLLQLHVIDRDGNIGTVKTKAANWRWDADENDSPVAEIAQLNSTELAIQHDRDRTTIKLSSSLKYVYQRDSIRINFNVASANHGETVNEILGDGDARQQNQRFALKQGPLTHISADTASGSAAALTVQVNDLTWSERSSLYQADSAERAYQINNRDDGVSEILFGDGEEGGRLPTGQTNIRAIYRKYIGTAANLDNDTLTTLLQKPLGVTEVTNPEPATGGADPEVIEDAKQNAPLTVLTLDRAVSELDYQHYAQAFSGVAKAHALWIGSGPAKGIYISLAGIDGAIIPSNSSTYSNLLSSLRRYGDPMLALTLVNYTPVSFALGLAVKVNDEANRDTVLLNLDTALREHFSFANRQFGQHVTQDEVLAVAHQVDYIEAVRLTRFYKQTTGAIDSVAQAIASQLPVASLTVAPSPAQLVTLSDEPIEMGVYS